MSEVSTFTRIYYAHGPGPEYEATPDRISRVIASMNESRDSSAPFKVRLRMRDGSVVVVSPKKAPRRAVAA